MIYIIVSVMIGIGFAMAYIDSKSGKRCGLLGKFVIGLLYFVFMTAFRPMALAFLIGIELNKIYDPKDD